MRKIVVLLILGFLFTACSFHREPSFPPPPSLGERLDQLYREDRLAWRQEMERLLAEEGVAIPPKHLALALKHFNRSPQERLCLEAAWRYLRTKARSESLSSADRELFRAYAEKALSGGSSLMNQRLQDLCVYLEEEPVCRTGP